MGEDHVSSRGIEMKDCMTRKCGRVKVGGKRGDRIKSLRCEKRKR